MRIFVLGDSFANNLFAKAYRDIIKYNTTNPNLNLSQISKYLISLQNENIENAKWWTDWLEEWGYEVINLGEEGCTNQQIFYQFAKINKEFREGDRIILHWTDHCRFDWVVEEYGRVIWVQPNMGGFQEPLRSILHNQSVCIDESFKNKNAMLSYNLIPFMNWIVEKHSEYNPIVWSIFSNTTNYLDKSRHIWHNSFDFVKNVNDKWKIKDETGEIFNDTHYGRYGNYYIAVLFDETIKSGITTNFNDKDNISLIFSNSINRIKNKNLIFVNPITWTE